MNESQTRLTKIDPKLKASGWSIVEDSYILTEVAITRGRISKTVKAKPQKADYILTYKSCKLAVVEAKSDEKTAAEGVMQAKEYASKLCIRYTYATNGDQIYFMDLETGEEHPVDDFPTPAELWKMTFGDVDEWRDRFNTQPLYKDGNKEPRYYQEIAVNRVLAAVAKGQERILLTMATGTGKTYIAFQICYKLFQTRWNVKKTNNRPRILFLADRNILANQAKGGFDGFAEDALVRIKPGEIKKEGRVPTNGSIFFTIFQTFDSGGEGSEYFGQYPKDFFDFIIVDECHRGGSKDESRWRGILEYFESAYQLGLTATPRRDVNVDTYKYFGAPVYEYSLKEGISDGFLTPFRHVKMQGTLDDYIYSPEDEIESGDIEEGKVYTENDFYNGNIEIRERDFSRVKEFMKYIGDEKTLIFCYTQNHAAHIRDMVNQVRKGNPKYAVRVTANDGAIGETYLKEFQDNEKTIPTVLTTSQKLSTGVDARNVRNIVLLRPVNSMIEFKQIVGRGTRLYDGKYYFTIYDFVKAYEKFQDPSWDGEPVCSKCGNNPCTCTIKPTIAPKKNPALIDDDDSITLIDQCPKCGNFPCTCVKKERLIIKLSDNRARRIQYVKSDMFWGADGKPVSVENFLETMFGQLPEFFTSIRDLQEQWSVPQTRAALLEKLADAGYGKDVLSQIRTLIDADGSDLLDVLEYVAYAIEPIKRVDRAKKVETYRDTLTAQQRAFVDYVANLYIQNGFEELDSDKLPTLMTMKFGTVQDGMVALGGINEAKAVFSGFQRSLYLG